MSDVRKQRTQMVQAWSRMIADTSNPLGERELGKSDPRRAVTDRGYASRWMRALGDRVSLATDLATALDAADEARARLTDAQTALEAEKERVARERRAELEREEEARREARRARFEFGQAREPGKGIVAWPYDAAPDARGVWVVEVRIEDGRATIFAADEPSRVRRDRVDALDLRPPTTTDLSRYLDVDMLDAVDIEVAIYESPDPVEWVVYDPAKWERKAAERAAPRDDDAPEAAEGPSVADAISAGASTTSEFTKALGVSEVTARKMLRDYGLVPVKDGKFTRWTDPKAGGE
jgi:hypothetical protein